MWLKQEQNREQSKPRKILFEINEILIFVKISKYCLKFVIVRLNSDYYCQQQINTRAEPLYTPPPNNICNALYIHNMYTNRSLTITIDSDDHYKNITSALENSEQYFNTERWEEMLTLVPVLRHLTLQWQEKTPGIVEGPSWRSLVRWCLYLSQVPTAKVCRRFRYQIW